MIVELPTPLSRGALLAAAHAASGRGGALLLGDGWTSDALVVDPLDELRVPHGTPLAAVASLVAARCDGPRSPGWNGRPAGPRAVGYLAYEAARDLERPAWSRVETRPPPIGAAAIVRTYAATLVRDPHTGRAAIEGDDRNSIEALRALLASPPVTPRVVTLTPVDDDASHAARIERALALIAAGDLYQVNLARELSGRAEGTAAELLAGLLGRATARFGAALDLDDHLVVSSSPELFLDVDGRALCTSPIKGTRPRGVDAETDEALARALDADPKERAELTMVVDLERNDLGRVAAIGSVRAGTPYAARSRTVHHRVCDVRARAAEGVGLAQILAAMLPSGSVTGAPKVRAMEVIAELERSRRGVYCGALFGFGRDHRLQANMAIRTLIVDLRTGEASYHSGGGIVAGSDPGREVAETLWKSRQVVAQ
ncbi:MAG: anthranilate synthase component I family protein [Myxococcales bacterium]|nr:anthranilate synthase component I family protein [Myxococcales bacterium]